MMMAVVLTGGSVMGCAGSGGSASAPDQGTAEAVSAQAAGEAAPAGSEGDQEADPEIKSDVTYTLSFWHGATDDVRQQMYDHGIQLFN